MTTQSDCVDLTFHDLISIRLVAVSSPLAEIAALYFDQTEIEQAPDITVRFVDQLPGTLRYILMRESGFTDDAFLLLQGKQHPYKKVQFPFEKIGQPCEIVCEAGIDLISVLLPVINLIALAKGIVPLHASACLYNDVGILASGLPEGGKTSALLALAAHGAHPISDDWVYLDGKGVMRGIPTPITLRSWQLDDLPDYRAKISLGDRWRLQAIRLAMASERLMPHRMRQTFPPGKLFSKLVSKLSRQRYVEMAPNKLFGNEMKTLTGQLDKILLLVSHDAPDIVVTAVDADELSKRFIFAQEHEWLDFTAQYLGFRFAFPDQTNTLVERAPNLRRDLITQHFADKPAFIVAHPHPVRLPALFEAIQPLVAL